MLHKKRPRIFISYTGREWLQIENCIKEELGEKREPVINYMIREIKKLETSYLNFHPIEDSKLQPEERIYYIPDESFEILNTLAQKLNIKPSTIVSRLLLNPLLKK